MMRNRHFTGAGGARLAASVFEVAAPRGVTALLLHGGGQTRHAWVQTAKALAQAGISVIALDQRGHGNSEWIVEGAYAFADFGADVTAVADTLSRETGRAPVVVGASLGGIAALLAMATRANVFAGLVLVDVTPTLDPQGVANVRSFMGARAQEGFASVEEAASAIAAYLPHRPRPNSLEGLRKNLRRRNDGRYYWHWDPRFLDGPRPVGAHDAGLQSALEGAARAASVPVLLVRGLESELVREREAAEFRALCPQAEFVDVAGARHMVAGDRNDAFAAAIVEFLLRRFG